MAWRLIPASATNAYSSFSEIMADAIRQDLDWLKSTMSDGATAAQVIDCSTITVKAAGVGLTVDNNGSIGGTLSANVLTSTTMPTSRHDIYLIQHFMGW